MSSSKDSGIETDLQQSVDTMTAVRSNRTVLRTIDRTRIRDQKVSTWEQNCILLPRAHFLIVRTQIKNNILYGRIVYTFYWWSAFMQLSEEKPQEAGGWAINHGERNEMRALNKQILWCSNTPFLTSKLESMAAGFAWLGFFFKCEKQKQTCILSILFSHLYLLNGKRILCSSLLSGKFEEELYFKF